MASPPFSIAETVPADADFVRNFPALERTFRDIVESWLTVHSDPASGYAKFPVDTTANLAALSPAQPIGSQRYDTTVNSLQVKVDASTWVNVGPPAGTVAVFFQETAPLGWTKLTDLGGDFDGSIIELVTGATGGDLVAGTAVGSILTSRTILQANLPNVNFTVTGTAGADGDHSHTGATGGASSTHTHTFSETSQPGGEHFHYMFAGTEADIVITDDFSPSFERQGAGDNDYSIGYDAVDQAEATLGRTSVDTDHTHVISGTTSVESVGHTHAISASGTHTHAVTGNAASGGSGTAVDFAVKRVRAILCQKN